MNIETTFLSFRGRSYTCLSNFKNYRCFSQISGKILRLFYVICSVAFLFFNESPHWGGSIYEKELVMYVYQYSIVEYSLQILNRIELVFFCKLQFTLTTFYMWIFAADMHIWFDSSFSVSIERFLLKLLGGLGILSGKTYIPI